ncbi:hypothetical protein J437_LFUL018150 [Ladona fulva]|uniref:DUF4371 domain-containing protein n=1 Tax=Ladona fulva TaxID=123851 RepID=A0A8K0PA17_LADFU|nr:hypothetical protein J437_LFUL018150 [Ladona fulva]
MPLSRNTVKDRISKMTKNVSEQLTKDIASCKYFSICVDGSMDRTLSARIAIIVRLSLCDEIREELINLVTLPERTEICKAVVNELNVKNFDFSKEVSVTTDGAPSMVGREAGFVSLAFSSGVSLHYKTGNFVSKILVANFISARPLKTRQFQNLMSEVNSIYKGLLMYNNICWFSRGYILQRIVECFEEIHMFMMDEKLSCQELYDVLWACRLMFFTDFSQDLNDLNIKLQGLGKTIDLIRAFEIKLGVFIHGINTGKFKY